ASAFVWQPGRFAYGQPAAAVVLGAWRRDAQHYVGLWGQDRVARGVEIPFRAHQVLIDPTRPKSAIAVARRPGEFIARIDLETMQLTTLEMIDSQVVANGHAMLGADFTTLLVAENDAMSGEGFIGVYDLASLKCRGR